MAAELLELYQELGQLMWDLFQQRTIETTLTSLVEQNSLIEDVHHRVNPFLIVQRQPVEPLRHGGVVVGRAGKLRIALMPAHEPVHGGQELVAAVIRQRRPAFALALGRERTIAQSANRERLELSGCIWQLTSCAPHRVQTSRRST